MDKIAVINLYSGTLIALHLDAVRANLQVKDDNSYHLGVVVQLRIVINKTRKLFLI